MKKYFETDNEIKLFKRVCQLKTKDYDNNPDMGFGPWPYTIVQNEAQLIGIDLTRDEAKRIANKIWPNEI